MTSIIIILYRQIKVITILVLKENDTENRDKKCLRRGNK